MPKLDFLNFFQLIQNLSYSINKSSSSTNINSFIDANKYPFFYNTFSIISNIIAFLPFGSQAATHNVKDVYKTLPLYQSQWPGTIIQTYNPDEFFVNTVNYFGLLSAGSIWGQVTNTICDMSHMSNTSLLMK